MIKRIPHHSILLKTIKLLFLTFPVVIYSLSVLADQCAYITKEQALQTVSRLEVGQTIYKLCEPCGETLAQPVTIKFLAASHVGYEDYWEVKVNKIGIDLAYVFIESGTGDALINLAAAIGCPATNVSTILPKLSEIR